MPNYYGVEWPKGTTQLTAEIGFVRNNGYIHSCGKRCGKGLFYHFKQCQLLLWPEGEDHHRWSDLMLREILENRLTAITGSRDSGKTHVALTRYGLTDYYCWPNESLFLVSSTDLRGLQLRVWGDMKDMHRKARARWPKLPGTVLESLHGIFSDEITDDTPIRDIRKGLICIPCLDRKGQWVGGLEKFVGIKQRRRRLLGDEVQFMHPDYLTVMSNLDEGDFKAVLVGNTLANRKALDKAAEPVEGWEHRAQPEKTDVFKNRFDGTTIQLIGTDSPNFDEPPEAPVRFPYMVSRTSEARVAARWGKDSEQYHSQISGLRKTGLFMHRVLTEPMCKENKAFEPVIWDGSAPRIKVYGVDCGYGGDRAIAGWCEFGACVSGEIIFCPYEPREIQLNVDKDVEKQIAGYVKKEMALQGIPAAQMGFDPGMRSTMAVTFAQEIGLDVNAIVFGGPATARPVCRDELIWDDVLQAKRLKRCNEQFDRFVTELWFVVRYTVLSKQMRQLPVAVAEEFYEREWAKGKGDRYELETKEEMKERLGFSPDLADWLVICVEMARRHGFQIEFIPDPTALQSVNDDYLKQELTKYQSTVRKRTLSYK